MFTSIVVEYDSPVIIMIKLHPFVGHEINFIWHIVKVTFLQMMIHGDAVHTIFT